MSEHSTKVGELRHTPAPQLAPGARVGRYRIEGLLGQGGGGQVYEATDPELSRRVAIKLVPIDSLQAGVSDGRLREEAQRVAQLSHPNVISVFDLGRFEGGLFMAMELVRGATLRQFVQMQGQRGSEGRRAILRAFLEAGEGLAAVHDAGIVHRDFKPDNVMVASDGRVLVMDFGLARLTEGGPRQVRGLQAGTLAYMAPEQLVGGKVDPRADQFAFCVALHEALYGVRPFAAATPTERLERIRSGQSDRGRNPPRLSKRVQQALRVGLSLHPEDRFETQHQVLELLRPPRPWVRHAALAGVLGLLGLAAGWSYGSHRSSVCTRPERHIADLWSPQRTQSLVRRLPDAEVHPAREQLVEGAIGRELSDWNMAFRAACVRAKAAGPLASVARDPEVSCLLGQLSTAESKLQVLESWQAPNLSATLDVVEGLISTGPCKLRRGKDPNTDAPTDEVLRFAEESRANLARAHAMRVTGQFEQGLLLARDTLARARAFEHEPVLAAALYESATLQSKLGDYSGALDLLAEAFPLAYGHDLHTLVADIAIAQSVILGSYLGDVPRGATHAQMALAALARIGPDPSRRSQVLVTMAQLLRHEGKLQDARSTLERAIEIRTQYSGRQGRDVAYALLNLGDILLELEEAELAHAAFDEAFTTLKRKYGPKHPVLVPVLNGRGSASLALGHHDLARADFEAARELGEQRLAQRHPHLSRARLGLGRVLLGQGSAERSVEILSQAGDDLEGVLGPEHKDTLAARRALKTARDAGAKQRISKEERNSAAAGKGEFGAQ